MSTTTNTNTNTITTAVDNLINTLNTAKEDAVKFDTKGNKAAGTRIRKALMEVTTGCKELRKTVQEIKNNS